jgi:hypothetical protein
MSGTRGDGPPARRTTTRDRPPHGRRSCVRSFNRTPLSPSTSAYPRQRTRPRRTATDPVSRCAARVGAGETSSPPADHHLARPPRERVERVHGPGWALLPLDGLGTWYASKEGKERSPSWGVGNGAGGDGLGRVAGVSAGVALGVGSGYGVAVDASVGVGVSVAVGVALGVGDGVTVGDGVSAGAGVVVVTSGAAVACGLGAEVGMGATGVGGSIDCRAGGLALGGVPTSCPSALLGCAVTAT